MRHFLNGTEIAPRNITDIGIVSDFTDNPDELSINVDSVILPREALTIIQDHITQQGVFEGIPYTIQLDPNITLEYYLDLQDGAIFRDYEIECKIKKRFAKDNFFDRADGFSFEAFQKLGVNYTLIDVPYLIIRDNIVEAGLSIGISLFVMSKELIAAIRDLSDAIGDIAEAVTLNSPPGVSISLGEIISLSIRVLAQAIYTAAILIAVIKLAQQLFELIFPKVRYYKACKVRELIEKSANYLGYGFQSTLLDSLPGLTILPVPILKEKKSIFDYIQNDLNFAFTKGVPSGQDSVTTLGQLIKSIEDMFNARTRVFNGIVQIERRDYWANITPNTIVPALALQGDRIDEYVLNTEEAWRRYYIHYQIDYSDTHTLDFYDPTDAEYHTDPVSPINPDLVTIKGLNDVNIPYALGVRKNGLNWLEKLVKGLFEFIDALTGIFGGGTNFAGQIQNRIGVLQISQQFFSVTKLLYTTGSSGKQPVNYIDYISAPKLWQNYHYINQIQINDFSIRNEVRLRLSAQDFVNLLNNNFAEINGEVCEILRIEWIDIKAFAQITYKRPQNYADGKVQTIVINE